MKVKPVFILLFACASLLAETPAEKKIMKRYPREAERALGLKFTVEKMTVEKFGRNARRDESDAYRHFVGTVLLADAIGPELTKKFLDAHETGPGNTKPERKMDFDNNSAGLKAVAVLKKDGPITPERASDLAIQYLKEGKLVVVDPKGMPGSPKETANKEAPDPAAK